MRVVVLGAGIAGISTAWYLAAGGAEVTVVDRGDEAAPETSHANGGHISTQSAAPWTGPHALGEFLATRLSRERAVRVLRAEDPGRARWFAAALASSRPAPWRRARAALLDLAAYSRDCIEALAAEQALEFSFEARGSLSVFRTRRAFARARRRAARGVEVLDAAETIAAEPALDRARVRAAGSLRYPGDATGDCRAFCRALAERAAALGATFRYATSVRNLRVQGRRLQAVATDGGDLPADAAVVALGADAAPLLRALGVRLPILPLRGYTLSAPVAAGATPPGRFVDAERRVVFARLADTFRAAGMADFAGPHRGAPGERLALLERVSRDWYPELAEPGFWNCLRPMTPDGPPVLGASGIEGLWLNAGLGPLGWTLGCGAGRLVADLVLGREPAFDAAPFAAARFRAPLR